MGKDKLFAAVLFDSTQDIPILKYYMYPDRKSADNKFEELLKEQNLDKLTYDNAVLLGCHVGQRKQIHFLYGEEVDKFKLSKYKEEEPHDFCII